jgi:hypothetical protein
LNASFGITIIMPSNLAGDKKIAAKYARVGLISAIVSGRSISE